MMIRKTNPVAGAYRLCNQEITIYHRKNDDEYTTEYYNAFFDSHKTQSIDKTGSQEVSQYLIVIPGDVKAQVGDKVLLGHGKRIREREEWAELIPSKVENLIVVRTVDYKYWNGVIAHVELGG